MRYKELTGLAGRFALGPRSSVRGGGNFPPPPPAGGDKKRKTAPSREAEGTKKGRTLLPDYSTTAAYSDEEWLPRDKPLAKS